MLLSEIVGKGLEITSTKFGKLKMTGTCSFSGMNICIFYTKYAIISSFFDKNEQNFQEMLLLCQVLPVESVIGS